jgi:lactate dehydrogenase-like 2-hydroxyacid dehydrogenase
MNTKNIEIAVPGNLYGPTLQRLEELFTIHQCAAGGVALLDEDVRSRLRGVATMSGINRAGIEALPALEMISNFGVGYDAVDVECAVEKGVMVSHTPDVLNEEVADTAMGLLINTVRELPAAEAYLRQGKWQDNGPYPLTSATLQGRTMGIYGFGRIGKAIAKRAEAFGMKIVYFGRNKQDVGFDYYPDLVSLASAVDTLMIVAPGTPETQNSVNLEVMQALGLDGVIINIGRGSVIDQPALIAALSNGTIRAAGLDVFADEPNVPAGLMALSNAVLLPHVGSASIATRNAMGNLVVDNLVKWFASRKPLTPVPEMNV